MADGALSDIRVIELADFAAGPWCGKQFADYGAEVIKVEPPSGDSARSYGPFQGDEPHPEKSGLFLYLNLNKLGITLDVDQVQGVSVFKELVRDADILIDANMPEDMESRGLTYEALREINPRLIMVSITPFGQTGPYRNYKGGNFIAWHSGGTGYQCPQGYVTQPDREYPLQAPGQAADLLAGFTAASAAMVAFFHRQITGEGQHVDISQQEAVANMLRPDIARQSDTGEVPGRIKYSIPWSEPCKDGHISLTLNLDGHWKKAKEVMGFPEWMEDEKWDTMQGRRENWMELEAYLLMYLSDHTKAELFETFQEAGLICFPVRTVDELMACDQYAHRGYFLEADHPIAGPLTYPGSGFGMSQTPAVIRRPAPLLGQHNEEILSGRLGHSEQELVAWRAEKAI